MNSYERIGLGPKKMQSLGPQIIPPWIIYLRNYEMETAQQVRRGVIGVIDTLRVSRHWSHQFQEKIWSTKHLTRPKSSSLVSKQVYWTPPLLSVHLRLAAKYDNPGHDGLAFV
jgi:hypothetical protein